LEFTEAIEFLAQRFSIPLQYSEENGSSAKPAVSRSLKSDLYELHKLVAEWFHQRLFDEDQEAQSTQKYWLEDRGFSLETAKEFLIGYAPVDPFALGKYLNTRNFSLPVLKNQAFFVRGKEKNSAPPYSPVGS